MSQRQAKKQKRTVDWQEKDDNASRELVEERERLHEQSLANALAHRPDASEIRKRQQTEANETRTQIEATYLGEKEKAFRKEMKEKIVAEAKRDFHNAEVEKVRNEWTVARPAMMARFNNEVIENLPETYMKHFRDTLEEKHLNEVGKLKSEIRMLKKKYKELLKGGKAVETEGSGIQEDGIGTEGLKSSDKVADAILEDSVGASPIVISDGEDNE